MSAQVDIVGLLADAVAERVLERLTQQQQERDRVPEILTPAELARRFKIRTATVFAALRDGELPSKRKPGRGGKLVWTIRRADAERWAAARP